jgi:hypothetical protein
MAAKKTCETCSHRTLWKATLDIQGKAQPMYFRSTAEFADASREAARLAETSPGANMSGATIIAIEKITRLWN